MSKQNRYLPEGLHPSMPLSLPDLKAALEDHTILEAPVTRCDTRHALHVSLGGTLEGIIPPEETIAPWISGAGREIALLSRVGKPVVFHVTAIGSDGKGAPVITLSRRSVQEEAKAHLLSTLQPGSILTARITHLEAFGSFLDIGCGIIGLLPIENSSVSRIPHPSAHFYPGQKLLVAVRNIDPEIPRFTLTHKELLGNWMENASRFAPGETVSGTVRSIRDYGIFVELTPNLSGLADWKQGIREGDRVSVFIKSIRPERMKIKLQIIDRLQDDLLPQPFRYRITDGELTRWVYSPPGYLLSPVETVFREEPAEEE